jgi:glycosyl transferase family 25
MSTKAIPIYIINLDRSPDRLHYVSKQLSKIEAPCERIVAVDGSQLEVEALQYYQRQSKRSWSHYTTLSAGEIGCALSWHSAWQITSEHKSKACIVLEDDIKIHSNFKSTINTLFKNLDENIVIDLSGKKGVIEKERKNIDDITLILYQTPPLGNLGAIYGKLATQVFLNKMQNFKAPVDTLQQMLWQHNVQTWSLEIGCLSHQDCDVGGSTIATQKKKILSKVKKELCRPLWRAWIIIKNLLSNYPNK